MLRGALLLMTLLAAVAGCEVAPGTRRTPPTASGATASGAASAAPAPSASIDAGAPAPVAVTLDAAAAPTPPTAPTPAEPTAPTPVAAKQSCIKGATHVFDLMVASGSQDETQRADFVKNVSESCTAGGWSDLAIDCIQKATDLQTLQKCADILQQEQAAKGAGRVAPSPPTQVPPPPAPPTH
jgi:hypothetical protein